MEGNKTYRVVISDRAKRMLGTHIRFAAQLSLDAAEKLKTEIIKEIISLSQMPYRFPRFDEVGAPAEGNYHKMLVARRYLILYQIQEDSVCVEYVLDGRQEYQWLLY